MTKSKHTPTPWNTSKATVGSYVMAQDVYMVTEPCRTHDAAFIVKAVNNHETLVAALEYALPVLEASLQDAIKRDLDSWAVTDVRQRLEDVRKALAAAKGDA